MYARVVECTLKPDKTREFSRMLDEDVFPYAGEQPGFVDLIGMISDDHPGKAFAITVWENKEAADRFYAQQSPIVDSLTELMESPITVAHYTLTQYHYARRRAA